MTKPKAPPAPVPAAFTWPGNPSPGIEIPAVQDRAPKARELASALRRIATGKPTLKDLPIRGSMIGEMVHRIGLMRAHGGIEHAPDDASLALEACIAYLDAGDIVGALDAIMHVRFPWGAEPTKEEIGRDRGNMRKSIGEDEADALSTEDESNAIAQYRMARDKATLRAIELRGQGLPKEEARRLAEREHGLKPRALEGVLASKGRRGRPPKR